MTLLNLNKMLRSRNVLKTDTKTLHGAAMNQGIVLLSRSEKFASTLRDKIDIGQEVSICDSVEALKVMLQSSPVKTVLVHLDALTISETSASRFMSELNDCVNDASIVALVEKDCPPRLSSLAKKSASVCLSIPLNFTKLNQFLSEDLNPVSELAGFWMGLPHKELHGNSRSLVTFTPEMFEMMDEVTVAAKHDVTVLLIGETGCGKTYLARLIHELSDRRDERLCTVACGALPPDLIESELFGYVRGAFTGADRDKEGKFAAAGPGTLLLDEIDVLSLDQQAKLLRVIETGEYEPVGSNDTEISQARLIVASNYNLEDLVHTGMFRTDLYYRLNILKFHLLPLRDRPWDVEFLARKFALDHSRTHSIPLREIDPAFLDALRRYHWPGNIREMENVIRRAVLYCQNGALRPNDLPSSLRDTVAPGKWSVPGDFHNGFHANRGPVAEPQRNTNEFMPRQTESHAVGIANTPTDPAKNLAGDGSLNGQPVTLEARVDMVEQRIIEDCLRRNNHRRKETAAELGISRVTLYNKMKKFGLMG